jgi:hypothetical protein
MKVVLPKKESLLLLERLGWGELTGNIKALQDFVSI